ncbi:MAG: hypothetical protein ACO3C6_00860 [Steroidobacteraceae bacterium]|jgi:hypothetical protein
MSKDEEKIIDDAEVIAVLVPGYDEECGAGTATVIVRDSAGNVTVRDLEEREAMLECTDNTERFRRGKPIIDPLTREIVGYELEPIDRAS